MSADVPRREPSATDRVARDRAVRRVLLIEGGMNLVVLLAKAAVGLTTGSLALLGDAVHSLVDLGNNVIAFLVMRHAGRPPDHNHPYGHRKFETLAVFGLALLLCLLALELLVRAFVSGVGEVVSHPWAVVVMVGALLVNLGVALWEGRRARVLESGILKADATHTFADVLVTLVAIGGWQWASRGVTWAEPVAVSAVACFVLYLAWRLIKHAVPDLVDESVGDPEALREALMGVAGVREVRRVRSRRLGDQAFADVVVAVADHLSTEAGHDIADRVEAVLAEQFGIWDASVHLEPEGFLPPSLQP